MGIIVGRNRVVIDKIEGTGRRIAHSQRGLAVPLHVGKQSRVLLAFLPDAEIEAYLRTAQPLSEFSNLFVDAAHETTKDVWHDIQVVRQQGYIAWHNPRQWGGGSYISFPVLDGENRPHAVISVGAPMERMSPKDVERLLPQMLQIMSKLHMHTRLLAAPTCLDRRPAMTSSARRALRILEVVNSSPQPLGVTAIAEATGTVPGTAYRSLNALEQCGFVERYRASTQYQIGPAASRLTRSLYARFQIRTICLPYLRRLAFAASETTTLTVPVGYFGVRVAVVAGTRSVRTSASIGVTGYLDQDMAGRSILAFYSAPNIAKCRALSPARRRKEIDTSLRKIRKAGFAMHQADDGPDQIGVALPIRIDGQVIAAVALNGPIFDIKRGPDPSDLQAWQQIIDEIEVQARQFPLTALNPFGTMSLTKATAALRRN
jgi:IclR family acetate operon transcriptional repressor